MKDRYRPDQNKQSVYRKCLMNSVAVLRPKRTFSKLRFYKADQMKFAGKLICVLVALIMMNAFSLTSVAAEKLDPAVERLLDSLLKPQDGYPHTLDLIDSVPTKSRDPDRSMIFLLDYYTGAAGGEISAEYFTKRGKAVLPLLIKKRETPLNCLEKYMENCVKSLKERNGKIDFLINAIKKGIVYNSPR